MVIFPWKRGEAVHARTNRTFVFHFGQEGASTTPAQGSHSASLEPSDRSTSVGCRRLRFRDSAISRDLEKHVGELEAAVAEQKALWIGRCSARGAACQDVAQALARAAPRRATRPA